MSRPRLDRLLDFAVLPGDTHDERLIKRLQVTMALASVPMVGIWGATFVVMGHAQYAIWQAGYCIGTLLLVGALAVTRSFPFFSVAHLALVMLGPFGLHWQLGGYRASGGAVIWCLLSPVCATMFLGARRSIPWFATLVTLALVSLLRGTTETVLTPEQIEFEFAFNLIGFIAFLFLSTRHFVERIDAERARSERLLLNVLPASIAERLKRQSGTIADRFESVTVVFSDIVGFTPLSAKLSPTELVALLDEVFSGFDEIADRLGLEKIKTIGDAYMLVGGLPSPQPDHAERAANAALQMRELIENLSRTRGLELSMRIGLHSGEVVAGVIGRRKFAYDLWGDTVNTASRMESHGAPGRVHVSDATRALLGDAFRIEERGTIAVKGKGEMRTFWLDGLRERAAA